jgi:hypothetical protein
MSCSSGGAIAPNTAALRLFSGIGCPWTARYTKGISELCVTPRATTTSQNRLEENFGCSTTVPPIPSIDHIDHDCALTWKNGRKTRYTESGSAPMFSGPTRVPHSVLAWVWTTALGRDVVPEVNMTPTGSIGSGSRGTNASTSRNNESNESNP